ncbi:SERINC-DOMAIN CONTAINING SERINE AND SPHINGOLIPID BIOSYNTHESIS PROTEIN [Salix koriyanagi]|uniref:SERINC-DOMAIN CONTAINING SERINE AND SPHINGOLIPID BIOSYNTHESIS PROTEIN n=1 Tax=Salix koriyanagi TaxID=2511006 RepID=A0A9Q0PV40_9ROSI|nr:SERINC-DOMAIN CONTAINING SERINE AND SPHINGOLIPID BIOSYNTHESIS PROTEIN [Salix koriyanagi]
MDTSNLFKEPTAMSPRNLNSFSGFCPAEEQQTPNSVPRKNGPLGFFRDYGQKLLSHFYNIKACGIDGQDCCHTLGVLRVSLGCFIFFSYHSSSIQKYIQIYGEFARVGAGFFCVLQLVSVIEFITWWNSYWMPDEQKKQSCSLGLFMLQQFSMLLLSVELW